MMFVTARRYVVEWRAEVPYAQSYPAGLVQAAGQVVNIDIYHPKRLEDFTHWPGVDTQQQGV